MKNSWIGSLALAVFSWGCGTDIETPSPPYQTTGTTEELTAGREKLTTSAETAVVNSIGMEFVFVPRGEFMMGSPDGKGYPDEQPQHRVRITKQLTIGKHEVTQGQYEKVMGAKVSQSKGDANCPVERVSWFDALEFCRRLSELPQEKAAGAAYRLPTEAEWEYVCRAGTTTNYSFGDGSGRLEEYAWMDTNSGGSAHPVGQKKPNPWGLCDMYGNVEEWCSDWYDGDYYRKSPVDDPTGPRSGKSRVLRGGDYLERVRANFNDRYHSTHREYQAPDNRYPSIGFRVVRVPAH